MNRTPSNRSDPSHELSFISLEDDDSSKSLKRKRDGPPNELRIQVEPGRNKNRLLNKYDGCPWIVEGKNYDKGVIG